MAEPAEVHLLGPQDESSLCDEDTFRTLCEMFPGVCSLEVRRCLRVAGGDSEEAAQLLLLEQRDPEAGEGIPATLSRGPPHHSSSRQGLAALTLGDKELREQILTRWEGAEAGCSKDTSCLSRFVGDHSCGTRYAAENLTRRKRTQQRSTAIFGLTQTEARSKDRVPQMRRDGRV